MKIFLKRKLALFMAVVFVLPLFGTQGIVFAKTVSPSFVNSKAEIAGTGETYQFVIKNPVAKSKYKWTSSNTSVAKITKTGLITSVGSGMSTIVCKITYPSKKTKTLVGKVTVTIPATEISISNATLDNNAYKMTVGSTADFDTVITPGDSTDKAYWFINSEYKDSGCVRIDDAAEGKITALKPGFVVLTVRAAKTSTQADADKSIVDDGIIINVVETTASVSKADITGPNELKVEFDSPVKADTVIGANNKLLDNIMITPLPNVKNVKANDPGNLTAVLSTDQKTLTITSTNRFEGEYKVIFSSSIQTTSGIAIEDYIKKITYTDLVPPDILGSTVLDDSGMKATINFTEAIDFTNFTVGNATMVSASSTPANILTTSLMNNKFNYVISADKKSVTIDLTNIAVADYGKMFTVVLSGIKDLAGNVPARAYLTATLYTDNSLKPQAQLISVERTSYYTLTATFSRAIKTPGGLTIENGSYYPGYVDSTDNRKVNYTISDVDARYTNVRTVSVKSWSSYNVISTDTTGINPVSRTVNFNVDTTKPVLINYVFDAASGILTLTFSENVSLSVPTGIFTAKLITLSQEVREQNITYTVVPHTDGNNIIKLKLSNMFTNGFYNFNLNQGLVSDNFKNVNDSVPITINSTSGGTELPGPYMVTQSPTDASQINLSFLNKLDVPSAQNVNNYSITGVTIVSAVVQINSDSGATVVLTVKDGSIDVSVERQLKITGVMGYGGTYSAITSFVKPITLKDNKKPYFLEPPVFDSGLKNVVRLNFSEAIQGSLIVNVSQSSGSTWTAIQNNVTINGTMAYINLSYFPTNGGYLKIEIVSNNLTDASGNAVTFSTSTYGVGVAY